MKYQDKLATPFASYARYLMLAKGRRRVMYMALEVGDKDPDAPLPVVTTATLQ